MNTKSNVMNVVLAAFLFVAVAVGCGGSQSTKSFGTVGQGEIVAYEIRNLPDIINVGDVVQAQAWAIFDDGSEENFTLALTWESSDLNVAYADSVNPGRVIGVSPGQATIRAYETPIIGSKDITVQ